MGSSPLFPESKILKAYSSEVEHTAHNGPAVGSIPTKLIILENAVKTESL